MKNSFALPIIYLIGFCEFARQSVLLPVMPLYTANLGASVSEIGAIIAILAFGTAIFMIPSGLLSDRFGRRTLLIAGLLISTLAAFLYTLTTNTLQLSLLRGLHGIGLAAQIPVTIAAALDLSPQGQRGKTLGWYTTSTQAGLMVGPIIGGYLLNSFNFTTVFITSSFISFAGLITILFLFKEIPQAKTDKVSLITSWDWLKQKALHGAILTPFALSLGIGTIAAYIPIYCKGLDISAFGAGLIITLLYTSSTMLRIISGTMSDKIGRKPLILFGLALSAISAALMANFHTLALLGITAFCFGIGMSIVQPSGMALTADLAPDKTRGLAIGMFTTLYQFGSAVGPSAMGAVAQTSNLETMFLACGLFMGFVLLIIYILFRPLKSSMNIA